MYASFEHNYELIIKAKLHDIMHILQNICKFCKNTWILDLFGRLVAIFTFYGMKSLVILRSRLFIFFFRSVAARSHEIEECQMISDQSDRTAGTC